MTRILTVFLAVFLAFFFQFAVATRVATLAKVIVASPCGIPNSPHDNHPCQYNLPVHHCPFSFYMVASLFATPHSYL